LLGFESVLNRDYPVVFGTLFIFSLVGLVVNLISDLAYMWIDPRIDFEALKSDDCRTSSGDHGAVADGRSRAAVASPAWYFTAQPAPLAEFQGEPARLLVVLDFALLFFISLFAELIANDRPFLIKFDGKLYFPAFVTYPNRVRRRLRDRGGLSRSLPAETHQGKNGTVLWPLIRYSYGTHNLDLPTPAPSPPTWMLTEAQCKAGGEEGAAGLP
jgi:hypothetical protein